MLDSKTYYRAKAQWDFYKETILALMFNTNKQLAEVHCHAKGTNQREKFEHDFVTKVLQLYRVLRVKIHPETGVDFRKKKKFAHLMELDKIHPDKKYDFNKVEEAFNDLCSLIDCLGYSRVEDAEESLSLDDFA